MRAALIAMLMIAGVADAHAENDGRSCLGMVLSNGDGALICYPTGISGGWSLKRAESVRKGFRIAAFLLEHDIRGKGRVRILIREMPHDDLVVPARIIALLNGLKKRIRLGKGYRLRAKRRWRRRPVIEIRSFGTDKRFIIGMRSRGPMSRPERRMANAFVKDMTITVTTPR